MNNNFLSKVYYNFGIGLLVTFLVAYVASTSVTLLSFVFSNGGCLILGLLMIGIAIYLPFRLDKISNTTATVLYYLYAALTGLAFASIFITFELSSIIYIFLASAIIFLIFGFVGSKIKLDLSKLGIFLLIGLFAIIILEIINLFLLNSNLDMALCIGGIVIFVGYVAYDIQVITRMSSYGNDNYAIICAFNIYLDFINIFIKLLSIFGKRDD